jgi:hypothetical protein
MSVPVPVCYRELQAVASQDSAVGRPVRRAAAIRLGSAVAGGQPVAFREGWWPVPSCLEG